MDGDPSQEDRIRLIGRLFFQLGGRRLKLRSPFCILLVQVVTKPVANLEVFMGKPWANMGSSMGSF
jgi:surfactin synthase thioesterase subunit